MKESENVNELVQNSTDVHAALVASKSWKTIIRRILIKKIYRFLKIKNLPAAPVTDCWSTTMTRLDVDVVFFIVRFLKPHKTQTSFFHYCVEGNPDETFFWCSWNRDMTGLLVNESFNWKPTEVVINHVRDSCLRPRPYNLRQSSPSWCIVEEDVVLLWS